MASIKLANKTTSGVLEIRNPNLIKRIKAIVWMFSHSYNHCRLSYQ